MTQESALYPAGMEVGPILAGLPIEVPAAVGLDGRRAVVACGAEEIVAVDGPAAFDRLDRLGPGWWAGFVAYDLGRAIERVRPRAASDQPGTGPGGPPLPDAVFIRFGAYAEIDRRGSGCRLSGRGAARRRLEAALDAAAHRAAPDPPGLGAWSSSLDRAGFESGVRTIVDHIEAGDCYQVNLTRQLTCDRAADPVALWCALESGNPAPHASFLRAGRRRARPGPRGRLGIAGALPAGRRPPGRDPTDQGHRGLPRAPAGERQGTGRERHDRRPRAQRPRPGLRARVGGGPRAVRARSASRARPPRQHRARIAADRRSGSAACCARRSRPRRSRARRSHACSRRSRTSSPSRAACTAARWAGSTPSRTARTSRSRSGRSRCGPALTQLGVGSGITADSDPTAEWHESELKAARLLAVAGAGAAPGRVRRGRQSGVGGPPVSAR